jgi:hypothetical protein
MIFTPLRIVKLFELSRLKLYIYNTQEYAKYGS